MTTDTLWQVEDLGLGTFLDSVSKVVEVGLGAHIKLVLVGHKPVGEEGNARVKDHETRGEEEGGRKRGMMMKNEKGRESEKSGTEREREKQSKNSLLDSRTRDTDPHSVRVSDDALL